MFKLKLFNFFEEFDYDVILLKQEALMLAKFQQNFLCEQLTQVQRAEQLKLEADVSFSFNYFNRIIYTLVITSAELIVTNCTRILFEM